MTVGWEFQDSPVERSLNMGGSLVNYEPTATTCHAKKTNLDVYVNFKHESQSLKKTNPPTNHKLAIIQHHRLPPWKKNLKNPS